MQHGNCDRIPTTKKKKIKTWGFIPLEQAGLEQKTNNLGIILSKLTNKTVSTGNGNGYVPWTISNLSQDLNFLIVQKKRKYKYKVSVNHKMILQTDWKESGWKNYTYSNIKYML
jgi:hypothetical protein